MKKQNYAIMNSEGQFLTSLETKGGNILAFNYFWSSDAEDAMINPLEENLEGLKLLAKMLDGQVVVIEAEYTFNSLDGEPIDVETIQEENKPVDPVAKMLGILSEEFEKILERGENQ